MSCFRDYIKRYCWLANTTGRENSFLPIDLLQEHNIRDIKVSACRPEYLYAFITDVVLVAYICGDRPICDLGIY